MIRRVAKGQEVGHLVEIMACPGGCLNGGGQIGEGLTSQAARRRRLQELEEVLLTAEHVAPERHPLVLPSGATAGSRLGAFRKLVLDFLGAFSEV